MSRMYIDRQVGEQQKNSTCEPNVYRSASWQTTEKSADMKGKVVLRLKGQPFVFASCSTKDV